MPSGSLFKGVLMPNRMVYVNGLPARADNREFPTIAEAAGFMAATGNGTQAYFAAADITPGQSADVTLIPDYAVPAGMRCYVTRLDIDVQGYVNWSNTSPTAGSIPALYVKGSDGMPIAVMPFTSLKGNAELSFPTPDVTVPLVLGPNTVNGPVGTPVTTFTINAAQTIVTAAAACMVANIGVGGTIRVIDGTGKGCAAVITACTTTTCTFSPAFATTLDATSVVAIDYQTIKTATDTTHSTLQNAAGTPFTANAFDNGYNLVVVGGTGVGQVRPISASTTAGALTLAYAYNTNVDTTTSLVQITNNTELNGAVDCCVADKWATLTAAKGIVASVNNQAGTSPVGSSVRIYMEGFFAA